MTGAATAEAAVAGDTRRHGLAVRITHWVNTVAIVLLLMTGANIFGAHPALYLGEAGTPEAGWRWLEIGSTTAGGELRGQLTVGDRRFDTTGLLGVSDAPGGRPQRIAYPHWATFPGWRDLGLARTWHLFWAWVLIGNGLVYLAAGIASRHLSRDLLPGRRDLAPRRLWRDIVDHLKLPRPRAGPGYGPLQKLAYAAVVVVLVPGVILTGMTMSPALDAALPWLAPALGGRQTARSLHWVLANLILLFLVVHVAMVLVSGPWGQMRGMITGRTGAAR